MSQETKRRLIQLGGSIVVPLPPAWIKDQHLNPHDSVEVLHQGSLVLIRREEKPE